MLTSARSPERGPSLILEPNLTSLVKLAQNESQQEQPVHGVPPSPQVWARPQSQVSISVSGLTGNISLKAGLDASPSTQYPSQGQLQEAQPRDLSAVKILR